jgi:hypothetical protein
MKTIERLNPFDMAILLGLFEGFALFLLAVGLNFTSNLNFFAENIVLGLFVGLLCTFFALLVWRLRPILRVKLDKKDFTIRKIHFLGACLANAVFLVVLFNLEDFIFSIKDVPFVGVALFGLVGTGVSVAVLSFLYNFQPFKVKFDIGKIAKVSPVKVGIVAGLFEMFILPVMTLIMNLEGSTIVMFTLAGIISGVFGGFVGSVVFSFISSKLNVQIEVK